MKCEEIAELLPDYLHEGLAAERKSVVERHLESCVECRDVAGLWKKLALIPDEQPSAASLSIPAIFATAWLRRMRSSTRYAPTWVRRCHDSIAPVSSSTR